LSGITAAFKQQRIEEIISTTVQDMRSYAEAFKTMQTASNRMIIGNRVKIEADSDLFDQIGEL